ncbi:hypothetical protein PENSPDRAFT_756439 [Peniophora sp. CONT]|nr:hypothetical protein PENSPDRAFT_756439 [Peniophora sp. CONT]
MLFASLLAIFSTALISWNSPVRQVGNRVNLQVAYSSSGEDVCVGKPPSGDTYLSGAVCGTEYSKFITLYGVGKFGHLEIGKYGCPTSTGADLTGASNIAIVDCDVTDKNQFWTILKDGRVTNDATGTCLTMGEKSLGAPLTLQPCDDPEGPLSKARLFYTTRISP